MSSQAELTEVLKKDLNVLLTKINKEKIIFLEQFVKEVEPERNMYFIDFHIFENLVNKYCYDANSQSYDLSRGSVPKDKLKLFRDVFLEKMDFSSKRIITWYQHEQNYTEEKLYNLLFYHIFIQSITTKSSLEEIFDKALNDWKSSFEVNKMPIVIDVLLPDTSLIDVDELVISNELVLEKFESYQSITGYNLFAMSKSEDYLDVILRLYTSQSCNHNFYGGFVRRDVSMIGPEFSEQFYNYRNKIREFIFSFYLKNFRIHLGGFEISYPWWIEERLKSYKSSRRGENRLTAQNIIPVINLHKKILEHKLLQDKELELILFHYFELHKKNLIFELILLDFMILEGIFTRRGKAEQTFRLSLNLALFISDTSEELEENYSIIKKVYDIRSKIIHGEEWYDRFRKKSIPELLGLDSNTSNQNLARAVHDKLLRFINKSLIKIIDLKINEFMRNQSYEVLSEFKDLYFLHNSSLFKEDSVE